MATKYRVSGYLKGTRIEKFYENEYKATEAMSTLNEIFAPFSVDEVEDPAAPGPIDIPMLPDTKKGDEVPW